MNLVINLVYLFIYHMFVPIKRKFIHWCID